MSLPGIIRNEEFASQLRDFSGMRFGSITPTDIDACIEKGNKAFVFIESKFNGSGLPPGQMRALKNVVDALEDAGKKSLLIIAKHHAKPDEKIDIGALEVIRYRLSKTWETEKLPISCYELTKWFLEKYAP